MCLPQIIVQVAIKAARPTMDASTPEPLKRLIAKCWAQVPPPFPGCITCTKHIPCECCCSSDISGEHPCLLMQL